MVTLNTVTEEDLFQVCYHWKAVTAPEYFKTRDSLREEMVLYFPRLGYLNVSLGKKRWAVNGPKSFLQRLRNFRSSFLRLYCNTIPFMFPIPSIIYQFLWSLLALVATISKEGTLWKKYFISCRKNSSNLKAPKYF